jgi:hypothetical protein
MLSHIVWLILIDVLQDVTASVFRNSVVALMIEAVSCSEILVNISKTTQITIAEDTNVQLRNQLTNFYKNIDISQTFTR